MVGQHPGHVQVFDDDRLVGGGQAGGLNEAFSDDFNTIDYNGWYFKDLTYTMNTNLNT